MTTSTTGVERFFDNDELIVSKTDLKGKITYANQVFLSICDYSEAEILGAPHSIIRHPDMPRAIYKLLWDTLAGGQEIFAYVVNRTKTGDHYWVFAHVTPTFSSAGEIIGYHSNRRVADREAIDTISSIYKQIRTAERTKRGRGDTAAGTAKLLELLGDTPYGEFVFSLAPSTRIPPLAKAS